MSSEPELGPRIGAGHQADVFECGQDACKVYGNHIETCIAKRMAIREARILKIAGTFDGVRVPRMLGVRSFNGRWGMMMSRITGQNFTCLLSDGREPKPYLEEMARLHVALHRHPAPRLRPLQARLGDGIRNIKSELVSDAHKEALLNRLAAMPDGERLCHGDFHPSNVMGTLGNAWIIDWLYAARGEPAADVCQSWLLIQRFSRELADAYVEAYAHESGLVRQDDIRAWRAVVAGARLANVPAEVAALKPIIVEGLSH